MTPAGADWEKAPDDEVRDIDREVVEMHRRRHTEPQPNGEYNGLNNPACAV